MNELAEDYFKQANELYAKGDFSGSVAYYEKAFALGHAGAANSLGCNYRDGEGVPMDSMKALAYFEQAVTLGSEKAVGNIGNLYFFGAEDFPENAEKAFPYLNEAAQKGFSFAMYGLSNLYYRGAGCEENEKLATYWAYRSMKADEPGGYMTLGNYFLEGYFFPKVPAYAKYYYEKAQESGVDMSGELESEELRDIDAVEPEITAFDEDEEEVWETFTDMESLVHKWLNPELFVDPEDRLIANSKEYVLDFSKELEADLATIGRVNTVLELASELQLPRGEENLYDLMDIAYEGRLLESEEFMGEYNEFLAFCINFVCQTYECTEQLNAVLSNWCYFIEIHMPEQMGLELLTVYYKYQYQASNCPMQTGLVVLYWMRLLATDDVNTPVTEENEFTGGDADWEQTFGIALDEKLSQGYVMGSNGCLLL